MLQEVYKCCLELIPLELLNLATFAGMFSFYLTGI